MLSRSASRVLLNAASALSKQEGLAAQQQLAAAAGSAAAAAGGVLGWPSSAPGHGGNAWGAGAVLLNQTRSKWWWSRSAAPEAEPGATGPEVLLGGSDGPSDLFEAAGAGAATATGSGGIATAASGSGAAAAASSAGAATGAAAAATGAAATAVDSMSSGEVLDAAAAVLEATGAAEVAAFAAAKADVWVGTRTFIDLLEWSHDALAMPWWEAIFVSNLAVRLATFPVTVLTQRKSGRMSVSGGRWEGGVRRRLVGPWVEGLLAAVDLTADAQQLRPHTPPLFASKHHPPHTQTLLCRSSAPTLNTCSPSSTPPQQR
jgi:hypothetical protein